MARIKMALLSATATLLLFCWLRGSIVKAEECTQGFSIVTPEVAAPGRTTAVLVTLHDTEASQPVNVTLRLVSDRVEEVTQLLAEVNQEIRGHGIVPLPVPAEATGSCILQTLVNCSSADDCSLQSSSELRLVGSVRDIIIRPARNAYRPGETVFFWVLALDHDLRVATDIIGSVFVRNPAGTKVALWEEVALDEGVKSFSMALSEEAQLGNWQVQVQVESAVFTSDLNVSLVGWPAGVAIPEVAMAEEHYVELRFGHEMRRLYKPGLPFVGKVEAVSTEKSVRVRVKVYDNTTAIYSQDIEITSGEGTFVVPAILADSEIIILQAELVSVGSKEIDSHYVLAREPVRKWNSSSDCYLLIEGLEHTLQPDEEAHVAVLSTCPCERDLHYVVTTEGHVTYWSQALRPDSVDDAPPTQMIDGAAICRLNFSFIVQAVMAPVSNLLVYYVTDSGEPISDVISFDVKLLLRQVSVRVEERKYWYPAQLMNVEVKAEPGALVCLIGGHAGTEGKGVAAIRQSKARHRGSSSRELDFAAAGMAFFQRRCVRQGGPWSESSTQLYRQGGSAPSSSAIQRRHSSVVGSTTIDQLWLWKCFNYSEDMAHHSLTITAPQEPGKWSLWALTLSPSVGLRFSSPQSVTVFRPLQVDFKLPASLRVGEAVEVDVKIGNNINSCMDVTALLALSEGAHFLSNGMLYVTEKLRLGPHGATSLVVRVVVTSPGLKNMTVEVSGYGSESCRESGTSPGNSSLVGSILRSAAMLVHPEGLVRTDTESAYFCANENVVISTSENFRYEFVSAPRNRAGIVFEVKVAQGAHIALSDVRYTSDRMYQVVLGDAGNTMSWIGRGKHGFGVRLVSISTPHLLSETSFRTLWVTWDRGTVAVGQGPLLHNSTLLKWRMDKKLKVQHIGFASGWGHMAEFRIWNYNDEAGFSQVLHLDVPRSVVPGSEQGTLLIAGGLALPVSTQSRQPGLGLGLGESTSLAAVVSTFTPLLVLEHMAEQGNNSNTNPVDREEVIHWLSTQLQTLLRFMKPNYSFGDHHRLGSHSNTVNVLELLSKTQSYTSVDPVLVSGIKRWIQQRQADDGSFSPLPTDSTTAVPRNFSDAHVLDSQVEMTAETLVTLLQVGLENEADWESMLRARYFLERSVFRIDSPCPLSLMTYALVLGKSELSGIALDRLRNASTNEEGDFGWQHPPPSKDAPDWLYEEGAGRHRKEPIMTSVGEYKASLYALMTYSHMGDLKAAEPVARYLFYRSHLLDRHTELLYSAVKAFSMFSWLALDRHRALTVSLATSGMELTDTLELRPDSPLQSLQLPSLPTKVFVYATGAGCATVQGRVSYSTYSPSSHTPLLDLWAGIEDEAIPGHNSVDELEGKLPVLRLKTCFRWKGEEPSGVLRLEVTLFSGFKLISVSPVIIDSSGNMADIHHGSRADKIWFVLANVSNTCALCARYTVRSVFVVGSLRPAFARVYPAGRSDLGAETFFHTRRGSPLLDGLTDDDLITWFGKTGAGEPQLSSNFSEMCECGQTCPTPEDNTRVDSGDNISPPITNMDATNVIVFSNQTEDTTLEHEAVSETAFTATTESSIEVSNVSHNILDTTTAFTAESTENVKTGPLQTNNHTITLKDFTKTDTDGNLTRQNNKTVSQVTFHSVPNAILGSSITKINTNIKKTQLESPNKSSSQRLQMAAPQSTSVAVTEATRPQQQARYINKERQHIASEILPPALTTEQTSPPQHGGLEGSDKLFVLDRDTLWGMLREVVHVELDKKQPTLEDASRSEHSEKTDFD
ncbi:C3 and PZP-like alpha-2-macroglobulin domain-containing protein 8 isoform X2 [Periplaneta americana]|uniref:C3 and PZP-like alpha-2-macroglobulin domain-containing protein 8 isoform X2 n=1 Tax=Periplaneta americana TaxID=6978 RepID=UPI0037E7FBC0